MRGKAVVIGSGIGGSGAAALLARGGYDVVLLESHAFPGGRAASRERDGFRYDFGVHMFSRGDRGPLGEISRAVGGGLSWVNRNPACRVMGRVEFDFPLDIRPLSTQLFLARKLGVKPKNYLGAFRLFRTLLKGRKVEKFDGITLQDFVSRFTDDDIIHLFINCISQLYFAVSYRESSAGEFLWCFSRMFNDAGFGYPVGGGGGIAASYIRGGSKSGLKVKFGETVRRIVVEHGRVRGVETQRGSYPADLVVSNAGIRNTIRLAGEGAFDESYVRRAEQCRDSNAYVTIKYALDYPVISWPVVFYMPHGSPDRVFDYIDEKTVPEEPYIFMPVPSNHDAGLAPPGKQLVIAGTAAPADATDELSRAIIDKVDGKVRELFPRITDALLWKSTATGKDTKDLTAHRAGECIGLAQVPSQVGGLRHKHGTPVKGLWLAGADAGARGIGTEMAAGSALNLAARLGAL